MAGDWIPWCKGLARKPEVIAISRAVGRNRREVAALLMEFWEWADGETVDGTITGVALPELADLIAGTDERFWLSVVQVGWLMQDASGICLPKFDRWLGRSAKRRILDTQRKQVVRSLSALDADKNGNTEQKRTEEIREEKTPLTPQGGNESDSVIESSAGEFIDRRPADRTARGRRPDDGSAVGGQAADFEAFWTAFPRKTARDTAAKSWRKLAPSPELVSLILAAVERHKLSDQWRRGVIPHASTWLNQRRWEDEPHEPTAGKKPQRAFVPMSERLRNRGDM